jgi:formylglycine-generating enzyme required for sulfatase activity
MLLQSEQVMPNPELAPDFENLAKKAAKERVENQWFEVPACQIVHGFSDAENDGGPDRYFAWDNERPPYQVDVPAFQAQARPVSNGEYAQYILECGSDIPVTWSSKTQRIQAEEDETAVKPSCFFQNTLVKTVYGPLSLKLAADWPVMASYNELAGYAKWAGYRIPTFNEVRSIYNLMEQQKYKDNKSSNATSASRFKPDPEQIFVDLTGCNIGLQNFHPMPVTQKGKRLCGLGDMGGAWEWTSF